jgi:hypothetical protein
MKFICHLSLVMACCLLIAACSGSDDETSTGDEPQVTDVGEGNDTTPDETDDNTDPDGTETGTDDSDTEVDDEAEEQANVEVDSSADVACDGSPEVMRGAVAGRAILCGFDHDEGIVRGVAKSMDGDEEALEEGDLVVYQFNPSAWDMSSLTQGDDQVLTFEALSEFVYEQGLQEGITDSEDVVRDLSDSFAQDILDTTHQCLPAYLQHYEVMLDCLVELMPIITCDEEIVLIIEGTACDSHNGSVADWVKSYLTTLGVLPGDGERETYENILNDFMFSSTVLDRKLTVADLRFYQYFYAKRDLDIVGANGTLERYDSFLNPNHWAEYPLVAETTISDCESAGEPRCCEYQAFIDTYDSNPADLMTLVNSCDNQFEALGPNENSQLYKTLLHNDGSVGGDNAFTIDEFFRPFILHYEKTTAPVDRGFCYWSALRDFASRTIAVDAGNASTEMNVSDMDTYIQEYNTTIAAYEGSEAAVSAGICEFSEN